jgi:hypothetical protein
MFAFKLPYALGQGRANTSPTARYECNSRGAQGSAVSAGLHPSGFVIDSEFRTELQQPL